MISHWKTAKSCALATTSVAALGLALASLGGAPALGQDEEEAAERIVVTGSRIVRRDFNANSPIVTIEADAFENRSSFNLEAALNQLPQFTPGQGAQLASGSGTPFVSADAAPGAATLNLRGLGANRNLVLLNGRRPQPINSQLVVDLNTIPSSAVENVEVITGGAAAVYGADAIAGVVNFILKDDFEGIEVDAQYGMSEQGDDENVQISALVGANSGDGRGNAMVGIVWSQRGNAFARDRDWVVRGWNDPNTAGSAVGGVNQGAITQATIGFTNWGVNPDGTLFNILQADNPAAPYTGPLHQLENGAGFKLNPLANAAATFRGLGYNDPNTEFSVPLTRYSAFASGDYDVTDSITAFVEANYTHSYTTARSLIPPAFNIWSVQVPYTGANDDPDSATFGANPANWYPVSGPLADLLNSRPNANPNANVPWTLTRGLDFVGRLRTDTTSNIFQITTGFEGEFPVRDWTWEVYGSHGATDVIVEQLNGSVSQENLQQILNGTATRGFRTATGPWSQGWNNGETISVVGSCESGIPLFNPDGSVPEKVTVTQDCVDYATLRLNSTTHLEQNIFEATMQGGLFDLPWSGEVRFALGATYRDVGFQFNPDSGLGANQMRANVINLISLPQFSQGDFSVSEAFGELLVPVLRDLPLAQNVELELGYRYSDYDTVGGVDTYKMLADWTVTDWLRFRGGYQLATRAPNVYELFSPVVSSGNFSPAADPCTNIPGFTAAYGNLASNTTTRENVQLACAELIARDGGFNYTTLLTDPNAGQAVNDPALDTTHLSNFRWTVLGYNAPFPITLPLVQGNPDLDSEVADTWTAGFVLNSPFDHPLLNQATLSVDWYQIEIQDTISTPTELVVYSQCLDPQFNPLMLSAPGSLTGAQLLEGNPFCDLINREPTDAGGNLATVSSGIARNYDAAFTNIGGTETAGVDVQVTWGAEFADLGPLQAIPGGINVNVLANFLNEYAESPFSGAPFQDFTGTIVTGARSYYDYKVFSTISYALDSTSIGLRMQHLPEIDAALGSAPGTQGAAAHTQFDLFGRWAVNETVELRGGIDNLLDEDPETVGATSFNANLGTTNVNYDQIGRRFFVGATLRY